MSGASPRDSFIPVFFILVADVFSLMLQNKVKEIKLHRVKVSYRGPETLHLLFADDSLLFDRASRSNAHELMYSTKHSDRRLTVISRKFLSAEE